MSRLTKRISMENEDIIIYGEGKYTNITVGDMKPSDIIKVMRKLAEYEDLEEQGLLLKLPCKVGTTVYVIDTIYECDNDYMDCIMEFPDVYQCERGFKCEYEHEKLVIIPKSFDFKMLDNFNKTVFLTKEEAEEELKKLGGAE